MNPRTLCLCSLSTRLRQSLLAPPFGVWRSTREKANLGESDNETFPRSQFEAVLVRAEHCVCRSSDTGAALNRNGCESRLRHSLQIGGCSRHSICQPPRG